MPKKLKTTQSDDLLQRANTLGLWGLEAHWDEISNQAWLPLLIGW